MNKGRYTSFLLPAVALALLLVLYLIPVQKNIVLSDIRAEHILYGNETGGGHIHGAGIACKSEFPENWDANKILATVKHIAANDNAGWKQEHNGYHVTEQMIEGVNVRVILSADKKQIITGYPVNMPRNPCPTAGQPANDNAPR